MKDVIAVLPGDGVGPEVIAPATDLLVAMAPRLGLRLELREAPIGGAAITRTGIPLPPETIRTAKDARAVLLGTVGGPDWDEMAFDQRPEQALLNLRRELGLYANLRPVKSYRSLAAGSPLKEGIIDQIDLLVVRELTGGVYFGEPRGFIETADGTRRGFNTMVYSEAEVRRIATVAFETARQRRRAVISVDKANVLETSRLWRQVVTEESAHYPEVSLKHMYVDNCAMQLVIKPSQFDVILTSNLFGDILSDEAAVLGGSIGMLPSASLGLVTALYEPIHGSAPDIAGQGKANPIATMLSVALMLRHTFRLNRGAEAIERAVEAVLQEGHRTPDIAGEGEAVIGTAEMGGLVRDKALDILAGAP